MTSVAADSQDGLDSSEEESDESDSEDWKPVRRKIHGNRSPRCRPRRTVDEHHSSEGRSDSSEDWKPRRKGQSGASVGRHNSSRSVRRVVNNSCTEESEEWMPGGRMQCNPRTEPHVADPSQLVRRSKRGLLLQSKSTGVMMCAARKVARRNIPEEQARDDENKTDTGSDWEERTLSSKQSFKGAARRQPERKASRKPNLGGCAQVPTDRSGVVLRTLTEKPRAEEISSVGDCSGSASKVRHDLQSQAEGCRVAKILARRQCATTPEKPPERTPEVVADGSASLNSEPSQGAGWEYLILNIGDSYRRARWVHEKELLKDDPSIARRLRLIETRKHVGGLSASEVIALLQGTHEFLRVDRIIDMRRRTHDDVQVLVKWCGLGYSDATWESIHEIDAIEVKAFKQRSATRPLRFARDLIIQCQRTPTAAFAFNSQLRELPDRPTAGPRRHVFVPLEPLELFDFQAAGVRWLFQRWQRNCTGSILADEMGLGKTVQAAIFLGTVSRLWRSLKIGAPFLVVCPMSLLQQWRKELSKWAPHLQVVVLHGTQADRDATAYYEWNKASPIEKDSGGMLPRQHTELPVNFDVCLTTYDVLHRCLCETRRGAQRSFGATISHAGPHLFTSFPWGMCVLDECTRMKAVSSKLRREYKSAVAPFVDHHLLLTATPIQNDVKELWSLLNLADPITFFDIDAFESRFGNVDTEDRLKELRAEVGDCILQRRKEEVLAHILPSREETVINIELTFEQKTLYRRILESASQSLQKCLSKRIALSSLPRGDGSNHFPAVHTQAIMNVHMELRKVCNHPFLVKGAEAEITGGCPESSEMCLSALYRSSGKVVVLRKILQKSWDEGNSVLVFSQFTKVLDLLEDLLQWWSYPYERLDGKISQRRRQQAIERFGAASSGALHGITGATSTTRVFLLSTRAGGFGLNLVAASVCVLFDCDWNPQNDLQAMARCHRIGQSRDVRVYRLITKNTYEAKMFRMASQKLGLTEAVMENMSTVATKPPAQDVERLLREGAFAAFDVQDDDARCVDERSFDEILRSDDAEVLKCDTANCGNSGDDKQNDPHRFNKVFFDSYNEDINHAGQTSLQISVDDPNFWDKVAKLGRESREGKETESNSLRKTRVATKRRSISSLTKNFRHGTLEVASVVREHSDNEEGSDYVLEDVEDDYIESARSRKNACDKSLKQIKSMILSSGHAKGWVVKAWYSFLQPPRKGVSIQFVFKPPASSHLDAEASDIPKPRRSSFINLKCVQADIGKWGGSKVLQALQKAKDLLRQSLRKQCELKKGTHLRDQIITSLSDTKPVKNEMPTKRRRLRGKTTVVQL